MNSGASVDEMVKALPSVRAEQWLTERRASARQLVETCLETGEPHDWIACDVIDLNIDCLCIKCRARIRWTMVPARIEAQAA